MLQIDRTSSSLETQINIVLAAPNKKSVTQNQTARVQVKPFEEFRLPIHWQQTGALLLFSA